MEDKTSFALRRKTGQSLRTTIVVVSMLVMFLYPALAHLQITCDRIKLLHELAASRDPNKIRMKLGSLYADAGEYGKAIECYRGVLPHQLTKLDESLPLAWERLDQEDSSNPKMHLGYGEMFQSFGDLKQAELEYKQALTLSPEDKEIKARLADFAIQKLRANRDPRSLNDEALRQDKQYGPDLAVRWQPPEHRGCLVTRCSVTSDENGTAYVGVVGQSGSSQHDRSALSILSSADFRELFKYSKAAVFEFACMSDGKAKTIAFTEVKGQCNFYDPTPGEKLSYQIDEIRKCINKQTGARRL